MHNIDELEEKCLGVLRHALNAEGVDDSKYCILERADDKLCLRKKDNSWQVFYFERGHEHIEGTFLNVVGASEYFFWTLTETSSHFKYREKWEEMNC